MLVGDVPSALCSSALGRSAGANLAGVLGISESALEEAAGFETYDLGSINP